MIDKTEPDAGVAPTRADMSGVEAPGMEMPGVEMPGMEMPGMEMPGVDTPGDFAGLRAALREFVAQRDWAQFHTPKNLASALCVEAAELLEHFQWLNAGSRAELGEARHEQVSHEMADVLAYLVQLADALDVDLMRAFRDKMVLNRAKYPAERVRGDARKYSDYPPA